MRENKIHCRAMTHSFSAVDFNCVRCRSDLSNRATVCEQAGIMGMCEAGLEWRSGVGVILGVGVDFGGRGSFWGSVGGSVGGPSLFHVPGSTQRQTFLVVWEAGETPCPTPKTPWNSAGLDTPLPAERWYGPTPTHRTHRKDRNEKRKEKKHHAHECTGHSNNRKKLKNKEKRKQATETNMTSVKTKTDRLWKRKKAENKLSK